LRLLLVVVCCLVFDMPVGGVLAALLLLYYLSVIWRHVWALTHNSGWLVLCVLPLVKATMDAGMDVGIARTLIAGETFYEKNNDAKRSG